MTRTCRKIPIAKSGLQTGGMLTSGPERQTCLLPSSLML